MFPHEVLAPDQELLQVAVPFVLGGCLVRVLDDEREHVERPSGVSSQFRGVKRRKKRGERRVEQRLGCCLLAVRGIAGKQQDSE
jgi:hypothetical protein